MVAVGKTLVFMCDYQEPVSFHGVKICLENVISQGKVQSELFYKYGVTEARM